MALRYICLYRLWRICLINLYAKTGCEIDLDDKTLQKHNSGGYYPLIVNATGDIIYPVGEKKLFFGKNTKSNCFHTE